MKTVPNQKIVHIAKRETRDKNHLYSMANIEATKRAISELNGAGLKVWLYMNKNQDNYEWALSFKDATDFGLKKDSYYNGIKELEAKGYLVPFQEGSNKFYFYENPSPKFKQMQDSEIPPWFSETSTEPLENSNKNSEKPERNNTNITENTKIIQYGNESFQEFEKREMEKERIRIENARLEAKKLGF